MLQVSSRCLQTLLKSMQYVQVDMVSYEFN